MLLDILAEHLEETEILWSRRRSEVCSPRFDLRGLAVLDDRLSAHLEGLALRIDERAGAFEAELRGRDSDAAFAAAATLLMSREPAAHRCAFEALEATIPQARQGIVEALCHLPLADASRDALETRLDTATGLDPAAIEVLSYHRRLAPARLASGVRAPERDARCVVARAIGRVGGEDAWIERLAEDADAGVRDAALAAAARSGLPWVLDQLRIMCRNSRQATTTSVRLLSCIGDRTDIEILRACAAQEDLAEAALAGLATLGYVECAHMLMDHIAESRLTRAVGVAFRRITGLEPPAIVNEQDTPEAEDAAFEDLRRVPDVEATRALWRERKCDFDPDMRWRHGKPVDTESWRNAPHHGDLLTRREELTRLWTREPERLRNLELNAPAARQNAITA